MLMYKIQWHTHSALKYWWNQMFSPFFFYVTSFHVTLLVHKFSDILNMSLSNRKSAWIKKDRQIELHRGSSCMLVISKEDKKTGLLECSGMTWRLIFVHTLIKTDLWGFSHLLEHAWLTVKLIPALSEKMLSPPDGLWWPFDGYDFS